MTEAQELYGHIYACRTAGNTLKLLALWSAFALTVALHVWVDHYFRRIGLIRPLVNGRSLPEAAVTAFLYTANLGTLLPAAPSLAQWLFLRLETSRDGLQYRFLKGRSIIQGQAEWSQVTVFERFDGAHLRVPDQQVIIPFSLSHYRDFLREVEAHRPAPQDTPAGEQDNSLGELLEPHVRQQVQEDIDAGRKIQAIKLVRMHTDLGLREAKDFVEQWVAEGGAPAEVPSPTQTPTMGKRLGCGWGCGLAIYVMEVLWLLYK